MSDWQPIETAPRDGKPLILGNGWVAEPWSSIGYFSEFEAKFVVVNGYGLSPTHWMPIELPPPPK